MTALYHKCGANAQFLPQIMMQIRRHGHTMSEILQRHETQFKELATCSKASVTEWHVSDLMAHSKRMSL